MELEAVGEVSDDGIPSPDDLFSSTSTWNGRDTSTTSILNSKDRASDEEKSPFPMKLIPLEPISEN